VPIIDSAAAMRSFGANLAKQLKAGDLIVLTGELGAGKTSLTQGIGEGLGISGITSPTFVISRVYQGPIPLVHVDAYRLIGKSNSGFEFDDLDLESDRTKAITVIEWGGELVERLGDEYLEIAIEFTENVDGRKLTLIPHGARWAKLSI
jgi:tRNA threonylcarbamoyladenosine biosynthesis protein TsaE